MMTRKLRMLTIRFIFAAAGAFLLSVTVASAQSNPASPALESPAPAKAPVATPIQIAPADAAQPAKAAGKADAAVEAPDRAQAYYHLALANTYEEEAVTQGRPELVTRAIEEYKLALNADPACGSLLSFRPRPRGREHGADAAQGRTRRHRGTQTAGADLPAPTQRGSKLRALHNAPRQCAGPSDR
jgi:hypothetical protein